MRAKNKRSIPLQTINRWFSSPESQFICAPFVSDRSPVKYNLEHGITEKKRFLIRHLSHRYVINQYSIKYISSFSQFLQ